jgi:hypothetical protein
MQEILGLLESGFGPNRHFAATQHHACYGRRSGLSSDVAGTAVPDPNRTYDVTSVTSRLLRFLLFSWQSRVHRRIAGLTWTNRNTTTIDPRLFAQSGESRLKRAEKARGYSSNTGDGA